MSEQDTAFTKETIQAKTIVKELTERKQEDKHKPYSLRNKRISGNLDLRHRIVDVAVDIQKCHFLGEVDLRHCEFEQALNLSGCTFHQAFRSGSESESHAIYRKDFICRGATF